MSKMKYYGRITSLLITITLSDLILSYVPLTDPLYRSRHNLIVLGKRREFERNDFTEFEFTRLSSKVGSPYSGLPDKSTFKWTMKDTLADFGISCTVKLNVELLYYTAGKDSSC